MKPIQPIWTVEKAKLVFLAVTNMREKLLDEACASAGRIAQIQREQARDYDAIAEELDTLIASAETEKGERG